MTDVTLVYPYFRPPHDNSIFRFPPLGLGYIAAFLKQQGISVDLVDCTFLGQEEALKRVRRTRPRLVGIYSMYSMKDKSLQMAEHLRGDCELLVAGGPLPTVNPKDFLQRFDVVAIGEGEETMLELVRAVKNALALSEVKGIAYKDTDKDRVTFTTRREFIQDLDTIPFPDRRFFDHQAYKEHYLRNFGYTTTSLITSRGCPFNCDFCSRPIFGNKFRTRSAANIVDEMKAVLDLGYERIWFADDCFTLNRKRLSNVCDEIIRRGTKIDWECLSRVDTIDRNIASKMKDAGCVRVFFGIESGNDRILRLMKKQITTSQAEQAVKVAKQSGIQVGAFFIVGYPGETNNTILDTVGFASRLPLDYLSFTMPYPIPGTPLYGRVRDRITLNDCEEPENPRFVKHMLSFSSRFSEGKLKFAILKGTIQFSLRKKLGTKLSKFMVDPFFERLTNQIFKLLR
ncbi:MAG: radical SAM protein [Candidatus Atabeyarchaeum deiterrae]